MGVGQRNDSPYPLNSSQKTWSEKRSEDKANWYAKKDAKEYARAKMYYRRGRGKAVVQLLFDLSAGIAGLSVQQHLMREKYINQKTSGAESNRQSKLHSRLTNTVRNTEKKILR